MRRALIVGLVIGLMLAPAAMLGFAPPAVPGRSNPDLPEPDWAAGTLLTVVEARSSRTLVVRDGNKQLSVRLLGVGPATEDTEAIARWLVGNLTAGEDIWVFPKPSPSSVNPTPVYMYRVPDGLFVNAETIRRGWLPPDADDTHRFEREFTALAREGRNPLRPSLAQLLAIAPPASAPAPTPSPAPALATPPKEVAPQAITVYITRTGSKYHRSGCRYLKSSIPMSLDDAKRRYTPCSVCRPPS
jgi:hypothetical protein